MGTVTHGASRTERQGVRRIERAHAAGAVAIAVVLLASVGLGAIGLAAAHVGSLTQLSSARVLDGSVAEAPTASFGTVHHSSSGNWAGYADVAAAGTQVYQISASWFIPTTTCGEPNARGAALNSQWVGIDGFGNGNVSQVGTAGYCPYHGASPTYYLWWEFYPYNSAQFVYTASAGDAIQAYVLYNPSWCVNNACGVFTLNLYDISSGNAINVVGGGWICSSGGCEGGPAATAECISEEAAGYQLAKYSPMFFYSCAATIGTTATGIGGFTNHQATTYAITQYGPISGLKSQTVSSLSSVVYTNADFTITWHRFT